MSRPHRANPRIEIAFVNFARVRRLARYLMRGVVVSQLPERARVSDFAVDVSAETLASLERVGLVWELLHSSYLLFAVALPVTITKNPNSRTRFSLLAVQT